MKPDFALHLDPERITLRHRNGDGWHEVGSVSLDDPDWSERLGYLQQSASSLAPGGMATRLILPNSQILYTTLTAPGPDEAARRRQIAQELDGLTPYAVGELVFDWCIPEDEQEIEEERRSGRVQVAVVARETLEEAETFAADRHFNPLCFAAEPPAGCFSGEAFFGPTESARHQMAPSALPERECRAGEAARGERTAEGNKAAEGSESGVLILPAAVVPPAKPPTPPQPQPQPQTPASSEASMAEAPVREAAAGDPPSPPMEQGELPLLVEIIRENEHPDASPAPADAGEAPAPAATPPDGEIAARSEKGAAKGEENGEAGETRTEAAPAHDGAAPPVTPIEILFVGDGEAAQDEQAEGEQAQGAPSIPPADFPPPPESAARSAPQAAPAPASAEISPSSPPIPPSPPVSPGPAAPEAPAAPLSAIPPSRTAAPDPPFLTAFSLSTPSPPAPRGLLAIVAAAFATLCLSLWLSLAAPPRPGEEAASVAQGAPSGGAGKAAPEAAWDATAAAPSPPPAPARGPVIATQAARLPAPDVADQPETATAPDLAADVAPPHAATPPRAPVGPGDPGEEAGGMDVDIATAIAPAPAVPPAPAEATRDPAAASNSPADPSADLPADPSAEQAADLPSHSPAIPAAPRATLAIPSATADAEETYIASIDPDIPSPDALALPLAPAAETPPPVMASPAPPGTEFALDERGLVIPTREGALNPDGVLIHAGPPPLKPPPRPVPQAAAGATGNPPAAGETPLPAADPRLAGIRPRPRPERLVENSERANLGGRSRSELATIRPRPRPASPQSAQEVDETPTAQAVNTAPRPRLRPDGFAKRVAIIRAARQSAPTTASAAPAPAVGPRLPTRASVAAQATVPNVLHLRKINLIGVYGTPSRRRALVRLSSGRYVKVEVGDRLNGGKVIAIGESSLRYLKNGRNHELRMPKS